MKKLLKIFPALLIIACVFSCAQGENYTRKQRDFSVYTTLGEAIRSVGGVQVIGGNTMAGFNDANIALRGQGSLIGNTQPLYVVDNIPIGNDYNYANSIVHPTNIASIRIVKGTNASAVFGEEGNHGAIIIRTKNYKDKDRLKKTN